MRAIAAAIAIVVVTLALPLALDVTSADTEIPNPSFETGTTGWMTSAFGGGSVTTTTSCTASCAGSPFAPYGPVDGSAFVLLSSGPGGGAFLTLTFIAQSGVVISGSAFHVPVIGCSSGAMVATFNGTNFTTAFSNFGCSSATASTDWEDWMLLVPGEACSDVEVTMQFQLQAGGFGADSGVAGVDAIEVDQSACVTPTPPPSSTVAAPATAGPESPEAGATPTVPSGGGAGGLSGFISPSQRTAVPGAPAGNSPQSDVAGVQVVGPIQPPNTGDAGLAEADR